ncbi:MAG: DUF2723 domain-containing protein, partial [Planctomycetota bacterium]
MARKQRKPHGKTPRGAVDSRPTEADGSAFDWCPLPTRRQGEGWPHRLTLAALALAIGGIYLATLHPGVDNNDRAEMQWLVPQLGVAHPPGYPIMMVAGKLFLYLPLPGSIAYRMNLFQALCGVGCCLLLYAMVRRITAQILPGVVAAGVLAFSSLFWQSCLVAEVYAFYGLLLLAGVYAVVRFVQSNRAGWLYGAALLIGMSVWNRPSELFVLPALLGLYLGVFRHVRLSPARLGVAVVLFAAPLAFSVAYFKLRYDPQAVYFRDDIVRDRFREKESDVGDPSKLGDVLRYVLGLKWKERAQFDAQRFRWDIDKYLWIVSGLGAFGDREIDDPTGIRQLEQGHGVSIGLPAILLALAGIGFYARRYGWVLLGLGLYGGNLAFYFYHHVTNNLDFIGPGIMGAALLAGLGVAAWGRPGAPARGLLAYQLGCLIAPAFLVWGNYAHINRNTPAEHARQAYLQRLVDVAPLLPENTVILSERKSAMVYRYLYHIEAKRPDIRIINERAPYWRPIMEEYNRRGWPIYVRGRGGRTPETEGVEMPGDAAVERARPVRRMRPELEELGF